MHDTGFASTIASDGTLTYLGLGTKSEIAFVSGGSKLAQRVSFAIFGEK